MALKNIHDKFAGRVVFLNIGLTLLSAYLLFKAVSGDLSPSGEIFVDPVPAFIASTGICLFGVLAGTNGRSGYNFYRDGLPPFALATALLLSGNDALWVWLLWSFALGANLFFLYSGGRFDTYDEDRDRIPIYFKWPF